MRITADCRTSKPGRRKLREVTRASAAVRDKTMLWVRCSSVDVRVPRKTMILPFFRHEVSAEEQFGLPASNQTLLYNRGFDTPLLMPLEDPGQLRMGLGRTLGAALS